jgi:uncharacterized membrane protein (UPF0127 family)
MEHLYTLYNLDRGLNIATRVQLAATSKERRQGLLGVTHLDPDSGLWICPCEAVHTFGMAINLDVVFLDRHQRVRKINAGVKVNRIAFCFSAYSVVELAAGSLKATQTRIGDRLEFRKLV